MGRLLAAAIVSAWLSAQWLSQCAQKVTEESHFLPAKVVSVGVPTIPFHSFAIGTAVLEVTISEGGQVSKVQMRRHIASITEWAVNSIGTWKFEPARLNGRPVTSRMTVAVTFIPASPLRTLNNPLPPLIHQDEAQMRSSFEPLEVTCAPFPTCPFNPRNPGTVILEAHINKAGMAQRTKVLQDSPPFTTSAFRAIGDWRFKPATRYGRPVESKVVLVFYFRIPFTNF